MVCLALYVARARKTLVTMEIADEPRDGRCVLNRRQRFRLVNAIDSGREGIMPILRYVSYALQAGAFLLGALLFSATLDRRRTL